MFSKNIMKIYLMTIYFHNLMQILIVTTMNQCAVCGHNWCCFNHLLAAAAYERRHDGCVSISVSCLSPLRLLLPPSAAGYTGGKYYHTSSILLLSTSTLFAHNTYIYLTTRQPTFSFLPITLVQWAWHYIVRGVGGVCRLLTYLYQE